MNNIEVLDNLENNKSIIEILDQLNKEDKVKILNDIFINYNWTNTGTTKFGIVKEKQIDMWKNINTYLSWTIDLDWEKITFEESFYFYEEDYTKRLSDEEFVIRILQEIDKDYKPSMVIKIKASIKKMTDSLLSI